MTRTSFLTRFAVAVATAVVLALSASNPALAAEKLIDKVHFLIPGGAGGGWDGTARGTGEALTKAGIVGSASYAEHVRRRRRQGHRLPHRERRIQPRHPDGQLDSHHHPLAGGRFPTTSAT